MEARPDLRKGIGYCIIFHNIYYLFTRHTRLFHEAVISDGRSQEGFYTWFTIMPIILQPVALVCYCTALIKGHGYEILTV